jgi:hypothetical protein
MMKYLENMEKRKSYHLALNNMVLKTLKKQDETTNTISKLEYYLNE